MSSLSWRQPSLVLSPPQHALSNAHSIGGVEVGLVEVVQTHETVFTARRKHLAVGRERQRVDGTEVAANGREPLLEHGVPEVDLEAALLGGAVHDVKRILAAGHDDVVQDGGDRRAVEVAVRLERLDDLERARVDDLGRHVGRRGDDHGLVLGVRNRVDTLLVDLHSLDLLFLEVKQTQIPVVAGRDDRRVKRGPERAVDGRRVVESDGTQRLGRDGVVALERVDEDGRVAARGARDSGEEHLLTLGEGDAAHDRVMLEARDLAAGLDVPVAGSHVTGRREEVLGVERDVHVEDGTGVALEGAKTLAVVREPDLGGLVLGGSEEQVRVVVEHQVRQVTLVALEENRSLQV